MATARVLATASPLSPPTYQVRPLRRAMMTVWPGSPSSRRVSSHALGRPDSKLTASFGIAPSLSAKQRSPDSKTTVIPNSWPQLMDDGRAGL